MQRPLGAGQCLSVGPELRCRRCGVANPAVARFCMACGSPLAADPETDARGRSDPGAGEERRLVTVLFADLSGYTSVAERLDHETVKVLVERCLTRLAAEVERYGGRVDKFIGDNVMAVFGAPVAHENDPERAVRAAVGMQGAMVELNERVAPELGFELALRIGVNTGEVLAGRVGEQYTVVGDAVNVAARFQAAAPVGGILVGERTWRATEQAVSYRELAPLRLKGKAQPVAAWEVASLRAPAPGDQRPMPRTPLVGRKDELSQLERLFDQVAHDRAPHLVTVVGPPGIGKSRLAQEFVIQLDLEVPAPLCLHGGCLSYGRAVTYQALADVLREVLGLRESDSPHVVLERLGSRSILGLTLGLDVAADIHPLAAIERLRTAWRELLDELTAQRPTLILIEDLHLAHDDLLDLLEYLLEAVVGPLLIVGTARPELVADRPSWGGRRDESMVWLEPLLPEDAAELVASAPADLREVVLERAEGNPFFIEELVARIGGDADIDSSAVPDSLQTVLAARIDQLPALEREALQAASVIGRSFWREPVCALLGSARPDFELLEEQDFIRRHAPSSFEGTRELAFKHALTRDVAYSMITRGKRAPLHAGVARWLENFGGGRDEHAALLAHHYAEAVRDEDIDLAWERDDPELAALRGKAVMWLRRAADLAVSRYEIDEGIALLQRALELEHLDDARCALWRAVARASALKFDGEAFWSAMETALVLAGDDRTRAEISGELAVDSFVRAGMWTKTPALERVGGWITRALKLAEPGSPSRARALVAKACRDLDDHDAAQEAAAIAERLDDPELCVHAWDACAAVAMAAADYEAAWRWRTRRLELLDRITDPDLRTIIGETPYSACIATCRFAQAREIAEMHDELTRSLTPHHRLHGAAILVEVEELLGNWTRIRELEGSVREAVAANAGTPCLRNARSLLVCAIAAQCMGDENGAAELERAADDLGLLGAQVLDAPRLRLALVRGDHARARKLLARVAAEHGWYARGHGTSLATLITRIDALAVLGDDDQVDREADRLWAPGTFPEPFVLRACGVVRSDDELIDRATRRFNELGLGWHAAQTHLMLRFG